MMYLRPRKLAECRHDGPVHRPPGPCLDVSDPPRLNADTAQENGRPLEVHRAARSGRPGPSAHVRDSSFEQVRAGRCGCRRAGPGSGRRAAHRVAASARPIRFSAAMVRGEPAADYLAMLPRRTVRRRSVTILLGERGGRPARFGGRPFQLGCALGATAFLQLVGPGDEQVEHRMLASGLVDLAVSCRPGVQGIQSRGDMCGRCLSLTPRPRISTGSRLRARGAICADCTAGGRPRRPPDRGSTRPTTGCERQPIGVLTCLFVLRAQFALAPAAPCGGPESGVYMASTEPRRAKAGSAEKVRPPRRGS